MANTSIGMTPPPAPATAPVPCSSCSSVSFSPPSIANRRVTDWGAIRADAVRLATDGSAAGTLVFTVGDQTVSVALKISGKIADPGPGWRLTHPGRL